MRRRQTRAGVVKGALDERARACSRCGNPSEQGERSLPAARSLATSCAARCTRGWCWGAGVRRRGRATRLAAGSVPSSDGARASAAGRSARRDRPVQREFAGALQPRMGQRGADGAPAARSLRDGRPPADVWVLERARLPWRACLLGDTKGGTRRLGMLHSCRVTGGMAARPSVVLQHSVCRTLRNVDANGQCRTRRGSRPGYPTSRPRSSPEVFTRPHPDRARERPADGAVVSKEPGRVGMVQGDMLQSTTLTGRERDGISTTRSERERRGARTRGSCSNGQSMRMSLVRFSDGCNDGPRAPRAYRSSCSRRMPTGTYRWEPA